MAKIALVLIATGEKYWKYASDLIQSAKQFFPPHNVLLFTNSSWDFGVQKALYSVSGYPQASLMRYHAFLSQRDWLSQFDYIFYSDVDMKFVSLISEEEIISDGITATQHPGYVGKIGTPETRPQSTAFVLEPRTYFCGGFNGGTSKAFLKMSETISQNIDTDFKNNITAIWVDESHLNRYLFDNPPAKILSPAFCYPETNQEWYKKEWGCDYVPKILALTKNK